jgi:hypothetical protein
VPQEVLELPADSGRPLRQRPGWRCECALLLPDATSRRVLLLPAPGGGWQLPRFLSPEHHLGAVPPLRRAARALLGAEVTVRRCVAQTIDPAARCLRRAYLLENHTPGWQPPAGARWVAAEAVGGLALPRPDDVAALRAWAAEVRAGLPPLRAPWARAGWLAEAIAWLDARLAALGRPRTGPVEQLRAWTISCLLRAPTTAGPVYLKAAPALFPHEARLTAALARWQPAHFPTVLASDPARNWLLLAELPGRALTHEPDPARWEAAVRAFAALQRAAVPHARRLRAAGAFDRRLPWLLAGWRALLADPAALRPLAAPEHRALRRLAPAVEADCRALAAAGLPDTLEHGDLYADNIYLVDDRPVFLDWSDGAITQPLLALYCLLEESPRLPAEPALAERLREAYLEPWTALAPLPRLRAAFALTERVGPLYQALIYHRIVRGLPSDERWQWAAEVPRYLRLLLHAYG